MNLALQLWKRNTCSAMATEHMRCCAQTSLVSSVSVICSSRGTTPLATSSEHVSSGEGGRERGRERRERKGKREGVGRGNYKGEKREVEGQGERREEKEGSRRVGIGEGREEREREREREDNLPDLAMLAMRRAVLALLLRESVTCSHCWARVSRRGCVDRTFRQPSETQGGGEGGFHGSHQHHMYVCTYILPVLHLKTL